MSVNAMNLKTSMNRAGASLLLVTTLMLAGCGGPGGASAPARTFDLGIAAPPERLASVRVGLVRGSEPFDNLDMHYRLAYRDGGELASYTQSRWAAPPATLLRTTLVRATDAGPSVRCALDLDILEFTQVFDAKEASTAVLEVRAALADGQVRVAERTLRVSEPNAGSGAPSGAAAMSRAAARLVGEVSRWAGQQAACRS